MRAFAPKVSLHSPSGQHIRSVPSAVAEAMVAAGTAIPEGVHGRIKTVKLAVVADHVAKRIGEPSPPNLGGVRFFRWVHLECGVRIVEHHPRALEP